MHCEEDTEDWSTVPSFLTLALDGSDWLASCPVALYLGKRPRYLLERRLSGFQGWSECYGEENNLASVGN
jgi:hypothetical protein